MTGQPWGARPGPGPGPGPGPADRPVIGALVDRWATLSPDAIALISGDERVCYRELSSRANRLASFLAGRGVQRGSVVAIHLARSVPMIASMLAVLKLGATYVMLDVGLPPLRAKAMVRQARAATVMTSAACPGQWDGLGAGVIDVGAAEDRAASLPSQAPAVPVSPEDPACIMFTSGSTGVPKGVVSPHRAVLSVLLPAAYLDRFEPGQICLQSAPVSWDVINRQVWGPLVNGGICLLQPGQRPDPVTIARLVGEHPVTLLDMTASLFNLMWDEYPQVFSALRYALTCGEAASPKHVSAVLENTPGIRLFNTYGPVESMCQSTAFEASAGWNSAGVPIGQAVPGKQAMVLDEQLRPVPPGVAGEMYLSGNGLAHGYVGQPAHTAERFVASPYGGPGARMYRTGDRVRVGVDGNLEFLGRADDQVKVRGYRVEPAEIRSALLSHPGVRQAEITVSEGPHGVAQVGAYVVPVPGADISSGELHDHCLSQLPDYLVPSFFVVLAAIPLTANGKLDRRSLPVPGMPPVAAGRPPSGPLEETLCRLYAELLEIAQVSPADSFFALGGNSLLAMRLVSRVGKVLDLEATVEDVFKNPTVEQLARALSTTGPARVSLTSWVRERSAPGHTE
jgi:nonribosomal peptide synthetase DhbF